MLLYIVGAVIVIGALAYLLRNSSFMQNVTGTKYALKDDPNAQKNYDSKKNENAAPKLTPEELLELSWKFLYDITARVMYHFTEDQRKQVHDAGKTLMEYGGKYNHVVDPSLARGKSFAKDEKDKAKAGKDAAISK